MNALEIVKNQTFVPKELIESPELLHEAKLGRVAHIYTENLKAYNRQQEKFKLFKPYIDKGFRYFVKASIIELFPYAASFGETCQYTISLKSDKYVRTTCVHGEKYEKIIYTGDIPDFALDRWEYISKIRYETQERPCDVTIHSVNPLPIRTENVKIFSLAKVDPVLIAWLSPIRLIFNGHNTRLWDKEANEDTIGIVLAVWDNDKELEL